MPRGRQGESRYKSKRRTPISFVEFEDLLKKVDLLEWRSLLVLLFYTGLRISEVIGDYKRKWRVLTPRGTALLRQGELSDNWMGIDGLWKWRYRDELPGIVKEDMSLEDTLLTIISKPLKHGKREGEGIELHTTYPHVDLIIQQWNSADPEGKVWDVSRRKMKKVFSDIGLYPHAFRFSRATRFAHDPEMSIADMMEWFGWARATTADSYIVPVRSVAKSLRSIEKELNVKPS